MSDKFRNPAGRRIGAAMCQAVLDTALEPMRTVAREHGYTLALHGSLARDIDMVAVPWLDRASEPERLMLDLRGAVSSLFGTARLDPSEGWNEKPHGRVAQSIHVHCDGHFFYFDVSIMPRTVKEAV